MPSQSGDPIDPDELSEPAPASRFLAIFVSPVEKRPRAFFRLAIHFLGLAIIVIALGALSAVLPGWLIVVLDLLLVVVVTWAAARFVDRRAFIDLGLRVDGRRALDLAAGAATGATAIGFVLSLEVGLGVSSFEAVALDGARLAAVGVAASFFVAVAVQEELVFRGYHIVNMTEGLTSQRVSPPIGALLAVGISSAVFGLAHATNAGATVLSTFNIAVGGGVLLSAGFLLTGDLAFSIGVHFAWNLGQALLGMPVSGFVMRRAALLERDVRGAHWLTGGDFGPEAGALGLLGMLLGAGLAIAYARWRYGALEVRLRLRSSAGRAASPSAD